MLKYLAKISMDILPSVLATIIGAYIVNHYINAKPAAEAPAVVVAPAQSGTDGKPTDTASLPAHGVKAKGVSEKSVTDKAAAEKPADTKAADVAPPETASHGRPAAREKAAAKSAPATAPVVEANSAPAAASPAATPDANDLARAAIERLRKSPEAKAADAKAAEAKSTETKSFENKSFETKPAERTQEPAVREAARTPEAPRVVTVEPSAVRPLPPPITVSTPAPEAYGNGGRSYTASVGNDDPNRITPPADIPVPVIAPPLDLRADAGATLPRPKKTNVADEMLSGMKSMFHSVLPKSSTPD
ncbi:hypothetical protein [Bradyrhizobium cosmicum]|uniref:Cell envelope biogenesis protein TolA n=1 Tax=Bradyrhizobium cosmicum TaxID=1404864 RepID=A0AAI8QAL2_9BRAD|nr:hypothetical protein [Bradyrhizobium cosmicum]BAL74425.1 hypothetical protein S23_12070 [Bradyrhizobium cosmicum]